MVTGPPSINYTHDSGPSLPGCTLVAGMHVPGQAGEGLERRRDGRLD
jgi:hypothetical protein